MSVMLKPGSQKMFAVRLVVVVMCCLLNGCSLLGYYKQEKARWAPPEEAAKVQFPLSYENGVHLEGPALVAVEVAMNEFLPPGKKVRLTDGDERLAQCLSSRATYDVVVVRGEGGVYFVSIFPKWERCGRGNVLLDYGGVYAVDEKGRILDVR